MFIGSQLSQLEQLFDLFGLEFGQLNLRSNVIYFSNTIAGVSQVKSQMTVSDDLSIKIRNNLNKRKKLLASPSETELFNILKKASVIFDICLS